MSRAKPKAESGPHDVKEEKSVGAGSDEASREVQAELIILAGKEDVKVERVEGHPLIQSLLDRYVEDWKRSHSADKKPRPYFYVSDVGRCARQLAYQFLAPEQKHDMNASTIILFKMGDLFHSETQDMLQRVGATTAKDIEFGTFGQFDFDPRGRLDVLLPESEALVVMDIKSKNSFAFKEPPNEAEVFQTLIYIYQCKRDKYFEKRGQKLADYGYVLYVDRGGLGDVPYALWKIEYSEAAVERARSWFQRVFEKVKAEQVPDRPFTRDSMECSYCRFRTFCWRDMPAPETPEIEADANVPPPTQEIVESMALAYINGKAKISELEREVDTAEAVLKQYFKATGNETLPAGEATIRYEVYNKAEVDEEYLLRYAKDKWHLFAKPQITLLRKAVDDEVISGTLFEKAMKYDRRDRIKVDKPKKLKAK